MQFSICLMPLSRFSLYDTVLLNLVAHVKTKFSTQYYSSALTHYDVHEETVQ